MKITIKLKNDIIEQIDRVMWSLDYIHRGEFLTMIFEEWLKIYNGDVNRELVKKIVGDKPRKTGSKYIYYKEGKYQAFSGVVGNNKYIGIYDTVDEAFIAQQDYYKKNNIEIG